MDDTKVPASNQEHTATSSQERDLTVIDKDQLSMDNEVTIVNDTTEYHCNQEIASDDGYQRTEDRSNKENSSLNQRAILDDKDNEDLDLNIEELSINEFGEVHSRGDNLLLATENRQTQDNPFNTPFLPTTSPELDHKDSKKKLVHILHDDDLVPAGPSTATSNVCKESFDGKNLLDEHCATHAENKFRNAQQAVLEQRNPKSNQCSRTTANSRNHRRTQSENKSILCPTCGCRFSDIDCYYNHIRTHRGERARCGRNSNNLGTCSLGCRYPDDNGQRMSNDKNIKLSHEGRQQVGNDCGRNFNRLEGLASRSRDRSANLPYAIPYRCENCGLHFSRLRLLREHIRMCRFYGLECSCSSRVSNREHSVTHSGGRSIEERYRCELCGMSFFTLSALRRHRRLRKLQSRQQCSKESKTNFPKYNSNEHREGSRSASEGQCSGFSCDRNVSNGENSVTHFGRRSIEKSYKCDLCEKSFITLRASRRHRRLHEFPARQHSCKGSKNNSNDPRENFESSSESD